MANKLCFNCFEKIEEKAIECPSCKVPLTSEKKPKEKVSLRAHFDEELQKLKDLETGKAQKEKYIDNQRPRDLIWIIVLTSILGILQIYTAGIMDRINVISPIFGIKIIIDGYALSISGFLYFIGIVFFYVNFNLMRKIYLVGNLINLYVLFMVYKTLDVISFHLGSSSNTINLPDVIQDFINNKSIFSIMMLLFGLAYIIQIGFMFRREILNLRVGR